MEQHPLNPAGFYLLPFKFFFSQMTSFRASNSGLHPELFWGAWMGFRACTHSLVSGQLRRKRPEASQNTAEPELGTLGPLSLFRLVGAPQGARERLTLGSSVFTFLLRPLFFPQFLFAAGNV